MRQTDKGFCFSRQGLDAGLSQIARRAGGGDTVVVWNFPIDVTFKATNAFGWPRIALSVSTSHVH